VVAAGCFCRRCGFVPFTENSPLGSFPSEQAFTFLVCFENLPADASKDPVGVINSSTTPRWVVGSPWWVSGSRNWVAGSGRRQSNPCSDPVAGSCSWEATSVYDVLDAHGALTLNNARSSQPAATDRADTYAHGNIVPNYYKMFSGVFGGFAQSTDLRVGVSMGKWETVISRKPDSTGTSSFNRDGQQWTVTFYKAMTTHNVTAGDTTQVILKSTLTYGQWNKRLVAVASDGSEHATSIGVNSGGITAWPFSTTYHCPP